MNREEALARIAWNEVKQLTREEAEAIIWEKPTAASLDLSAAVGLPKVAALDSLSIKMPD